jgi:hypothetical protein
MKKVSIRRGLPRSVAEKTEENFPSAIRAPSAAKALAEEGRISRRNK